MGIRRTSGAVVKNSVIKGNSASENGGGIGAVYPGWNNIMPIFKDCVIRHNTATRWGGAIFIYNRGEIINCNITSNYNSNPGSSSGGGIYIGHDGSTGPLPIPVISNCVISGNGNANTLYGGAMRIERPVRLYNCLISGNSSSGMGGGLYITGEVTSEESIAYNCTIAGNTSSMGYAGIEGGGLAANPATSTSSFVNCILYANVYAPNSVYNNFNQNNSNLRFTNSCAFPMPLYGGNNIADDPRFAAPGSGNYRLGPGSPCINAGLKLDWMTNSLDLDGLRRIDYFFGLVDMGAYEFLPSGSMIKFR